jgi:hypothetical protein
MTNRKMNRTQILCGVVSQTSQLFSLSVIVNKTQGSFTGSQEKIYAPKKNAIET